MSSPTVAARPHAPTLRNIPLSHNAADSHASALRLIFALDPDWEASEGEVKFTRFTDGITNTVSSANNSKSYELTVVAPESDQETTRSVRKRDRRRCHTPTCIRQQHADTHRQGKCVHSASDNVDTANLLPEETASHLLLSAHNLAPPLLARFKNGMMYRFIQGTPCTPEDLRKEPVWRGVARRLGQWHAVLPVQVPSTMTPQLEESTTTNADLSISKSPLTPTLEDVNAITPNQLTPNIWTVCQRWIFALPTSTPEQTQRKQTLQAELKRCVEDFSNVTGIGQDGLVLSHCDLLSGNVIILPSSPYPDASTAPTQTTSAIEVEQVSFIDYEYTTPAPAAFDLANHFSEWIGFACEYTHIPTRSTRRAFLESYLASYNANLPAEQRPHLDAATAKQQLDTLCEVVNQYRGIPGLYWGIWSLIQADISQIDFDYANYAEKRLAEYWEWRGQGNGGSLREELWNQE
jgi:ethanolamine kinase